MNDPVITDKQTLIDLRGSSARSCVSRWQHLKAVGAESKTWTVPYSTVIRSVIGYGATIAVTRGGRTAAQLATDPDGSIYEGSAIIVWATSSDSNFHQYFVDVPVTIGEVLTMSKDTGTNGYIGIFYDAAT